jgi:outer membrane protein assembly factor BamD (BamD/ComL family)
MEKAVYTVSTAALYEHASLELATADYDVARERFDALAERHGGWVTVILQEWYNGTSTTIDIERAH